MARCSKNGEMDAREAAAPSAGSRVLALIFVLVSLLSLSMAAVQLTAPLPSASEVRAVTLASDTYPALPEDGGARRIDISALNLEELSDKSSSAPNASPLVLLQNGRPMTPHRSHKDIRSGCDGCFSHWGPHIIFSGFSGARLEESSLTLVYPVPRGNSKFASILLGLMAAMACGAGLWITFLSYQRRCPWRPGPAGIAAGLIVLVGSLYQVISCEVVTSQGISSWDSFAISDDSASYLADPLRQFDRPMGYSAFLALTADPAIRNPEALKGLPKKPIKDAQQLALLQPIRAQKIFLCLSSALMAWALCLVIPAPIAAGLVLLLWTGGWMCPEMDRYLTECVTQSWLFLLVAAFTWCASKRSGYGLILAAALCGALINTRSAGIYSIIFLISAGLCLLWTRRRRALLPLATSICLFAVLFFAPSLYRAYVKGTFLPAPRFADQQMAFALQVARPSDIDLMPDEQSREYFVRALERKAVADQELLSSPGFEKKFGFSYLNSNLYKVARWTARSFGLDNDAARPIFATVARIVLREHRMEYLKLAAESFMYATSPGQTRIDLPFLSFWGIILVTVLAALAVRGAESAIGLTLIAAHLLHLAVIASFDVPLQRYINATELLVLIGVTLVASRSLSVAIALLGAKLRKRAWLTQSALANES